MDYWQIIKLATDTGLVLSLVFLLYRFLRSNEVAPQNNSRIVEAQVARMLQDAEVAGRELSQVLEKRQRALKETLNQIESTESRIKQSLLKRAKEKEKPASDFFVIVSKRDT